MKEQPNKQSIECDCCCHISNHDPMACTHVKCTHCEPVSHTNGDREDEVITHKSGYDCGLSECGEPVRQSIECCDNGNFDIEHDCLKCEPVSQSDDWWEKDFDDSWGSSYWEMLDGTVNPHKVKAFIGNLLSKQRAGDRKLTNAEKDQMRAYIEVRQREGWYHGNKEQFEKREKSILEKIRKSRLEDK